MLFIFKHDTTKSVCLHCDHFSRKPPRNLCLRGGAFRFLRLKFWKLKLWWIPFWAEGVCNVTIFQEDGEQVNVVNRGYERCMFIGTEIIDAKKYVRNLPDDPDKLLKAIENEKRT